MDGKESLRSKASGFETLRSFERSPFEVGGSDSPRPLREAGCVAPVPSRLCPGAASREGEKEIALPLRASEGDTSTTSEGAILSFVVLSKRASDMNKLEDLGGSCSRWEYDGTAP